MDKIKVIAFGIAATGLFLYLLNTRSYPVYLRGKGAKRNYKPFKPKFTIEKNHLFNVEHDEKFWNQVLIETFRSKFALPEPDPILKAEI